MYIKIIMSSKEQNGQYFGHKDNNEFQGTAWSIFLKVSNLESNEVPSYSGEEDKQLTAYNYEVLYSCNLNEKLQIEEGKVKGRNACLSTEKSQSVGT